MDSIDLEALKRSMNGGGFGEQKDYSNYNYKKRNSNNKGENPNKKKSQDNTEKTNVDTYIGAPYNFVPFSKKPYELKEETVAHNDMDSNLLSGEISVRVEAISPILISGGKDHFYRDAYNRIAIPGSSFRGLIRNNVQILSASSVCDDIDDYSFMYRDVADNGLNRERYDSILGRKSKMIGKKRKTILEKVKAGYIVNESGDYYIREPKENVEVFTGDINYFVVYDRKKIVSKELGIDLFKGCTCEKVSYIHKGSVITSVDVPERYEKKGWLIDSGKMKGKNAFYIIPEEKASKDEDIPIDKKDIKAYKIDLEKKRKIKNIKDNIEFYELPVESNPKPIFYIHAEGRTYFGFTPYLRVFYDHGVSDGIPASMEKIKMDFAKSLFGYSSDEASYKSRISFSDLIVEGDEPKGTYHKCVLGEPKASAYMNYLVQDGEKGKTYNSDDFELRGIKQYWLSNSKDGIKNIPNESDNEKVQSGLYALPEKTSFSGKVRFHNLRKEELGLLLWSIRLEENSWMNIGKGKPYGFGTIKTQIKGVRVIDDSKAYSFDSFEISPYKDIDTAEYIDIYKAFLKNSMGIDWEKDSSIRSFFIMKDSTKIPGNKETRYMTLKESKVQKKGRVSNALKSPENVVK